MNAEKTELKREDLLLAVQRVERSADKAESAHKTIAFAIVAATVLNVIIHLLFTLKP